MFRMRSTACYIFYVYIVYIDLVKGLKMDTWNVWVNERHKMIFLKNIHIKHLQQELNKSNLLLCSLSEQWFIQ